MQPMALPRQNWKSSRQIDDHNIVESLDCWLIFWMDNKRILSITLKHDLSKYIAIYDWIDDTTTSKI